MRMSRPKKGHHCARYLAREPLALMDSGKLWHARKKMHEWRTNELSQPTKAKWTYVKVKFCCFVQAFCFINRDHFGCKFFFQEHFLLAPREAIASKNNDGRSLMDNGLFKTSFPHSIFSLLFSHYKVMSGLQMKCVR